MFSLKVGPQFVFLFAGDCTVAFTASSRRPFPICAPCAFFSSLFVVTDEACHAVSTEKPRRLLDALDSNIPIRGNANGAPCVRFDLANTALYISLPPPSP